MNRVPVSISSPRRSAATRSRVQIDALRPNSLSFIKVMASSSLSTCIMPTTGPKLSSRITDI
ncbi:hypothetical protein D3C75_1263470 [compost metagenome]